MHQRASLSAQPLQTVLPSVIPAPVTILTCTRLSENTDGMPLLRDPTATATNLRSSLDITAPSCRDHLTYQSSGPVSSTTAPEDLKPQPRLPSSTSSLEAEFFRPPNSTTDVVITEQILSQDGAQHALDIVTAHISLSFMNLM